MNSLKKQLNLIGVQKITSKFMKLKVPNEFVKNYTKKVHTSKTRPFSTGKE